VLRKSLLLQGKTIICVRNSNYASIDVGRAVRAFRRMLSSGARESAFMR